MVEALPCKQDVVGSIPTCGSNFEMGECGLVARAVAFQATNVGSIPTTRSKFNYEVKMSSVWLISDTHFGHENLCTKIKLEDGSPARSFSCAEEMDELMVKLWNENVRPKDKVYHLGDVAIAKKNLKILERLNGDKVLIKGNHDIFKLKDYTPHFRDIRASHVMNGCLLTHIPAHESNLYRFGCNIHGHTHTRSIDSPLYFNVCVEQTNYAPILFEELGKLIVERGGTFGFKPKPIVYV